MVVTQNFYPLFFTKQFNNLITEFTSTSEGGGNLSCKICLIPPPGLGYSPDVSVGSFPDLSISNSVLDTTLYFSRDQNTILFWTSDVTWSSVADGTQCKEAIVYKTIDDNHHSIIHFSFDEIKIVDGPFRLKMETDGYAKFNFN